MSCCWRQRLWNQSLGMNKNDMNNLMRNLIGNLRLNLMRKLRRNMRWL